MTRETREMAAGLELSEKAAQLTYYNISMDEPVTLRTEDAAPGKSRIPMDSKAWQAAAGYSQPIEKLVDYLKEVMRGILTAVPPSSIRIMVTVPSLDRRLSERIPMALELIGIPRKYIYLQDYLSAFFHYTVNQKRELWNGDVALLEYENETMVGYVLHVDWKKSPALVTIEKRSEQPLGEKVRDGRTGEQWDRERDRLFFEFLKEVFERRNVVTVYLMGDYFSPDWAGRSFQFLATRRHAFQGDNLYTRGACYAAMERAGMIKSMNMLYLGADMIRENLGMYMRVRGREVYYPLVSAGINWYEAHHECEFIADGERDITILSKPMEGGNEVARLLRLTDLPERPPRATRLRMNVYFTSPECCCVEVEDRGFGGFYRSSGRQWKRSIYL